MELWRLRIEADHTPGQLAEIAGVLAGVGANIVSLDVHAGDATTVADDLVVAMAVPVDAPLLALVLDPLDAVLVDLRPADPHELVDPVARAVETVGRVVRERPTCASLGAALKQVIRADVAFVRPVLDGLPLAGAAAEAVSDHRPVLAREPVKGLGAGSEGAWVLAAPTVVGDRPHVAVVVRRSPQFSFTETARVQAMLGVVDGTSATERDELAVDLPDDSLVDSLVPEIRAVDGCDVEEIRPVDGINHDPRADALETAAIIVGASSRADLLDAVVGHGRRLLGGTWAAVVQLDDGFVLAADGDPPEAAWLVAFVEGSRSAAAGGVTGGRGPNDVVWAPLPATALAVVVGRIGSGFRARERRQVSALARIADTRLVDFSRRAHPSGRS